MNKSAFIFALLITVPCFGQGAVGVPVVPRPGDKGDITVSNSQQWSVDDDADLVLNSVDATNFDADTATIGALTLVTDLSIAQGGTGLSTLPTGLLKGAGTSPV